MFPSLRKIFVAAERRLRANRGMGVPQGITNNLEDPQRALEGLTEAIAQEREDNAAARAQNEVLQAAVNVLQCQMAPVGQGGPAINAMQMQLPLQANTQVQQITGRHNNSNISEPPSAPANQWQAQQAIHPHQWQAKQQNPQQWQQYQQQGGYQQQNSCRFQQMGRGRGQGNMGPNAVVNYQKCGYQTGGHRMQRPQQQQQQQGGYQHQQGGHQQPQQVQYGNHSPLPTNFSYY